MYPDITIAKSKRRYLIYLTSLQGKGNVEFMKTIRNKSTSLGGLWLFILVVLYSNLID